MVVTDTDEAEAVIDRRTLKPKKSSESDEESPLTEAAGLVNSALGGTFWPLSFILVT